MRLKITLQVLDKNSKIPLSYQHELSSWIYKLIFQSDKAFGQMLHDKGFQMKGEGKKFKLFTFSNLYTPNYAIVNKDRLMIKSNEISFIISFFVGEIAQHIVMALFQNQICRLGDYISQARLKVKDVQILDLDIQQETVKLRAISPICVAKKDEMGRKKYLSPKDEGYEECFIDNLHRKYITAVEHGFIQLKNVDKGIHFRLLSHQPKSKLIHIKAHKHVGNRVRGWMFDFELTAAKELIEVGILSGFGSANAQGFGATRLLNNSKN